MKILNTYCVSFITIILYLSFSFLVTVSGQINDPSVNSIGLSASIGISPALDFDHDYHYSSYLPDALAYSINTPSFDGQFTYYHLFTPRIKLGVEILVGVHSYSFQMHTTRNFIAIDQQWFEDYFDDNNTEYNLGYGGLSLCGTYTSQG